MRGKALRESMIMDVFWKNLFSTPNASKVIAKFHTKQQISPLAINRANSATNRSLSIRRFWGKRGRMEAKKGEGYLLSPSPLGRPDTQAKQIVSIIGAAKHRDIARTSPTMSVLRRTISPILGGPGEDSEGERKSKRVEKYGTKKSKERREEPLGTMSYQTSSKRSPPFWLLIGQKNTMSTFTPILCNTQSITNTKHYSKEWAT